MLRIVRRSNRMAQRRPEGTWQLRVFHRKRVRKQDPRYLTTNVKIQDLTLAPLDRFVIVDDREFYHFGASIKDLGHRGFMFSRIEEPDVVSALRTKLVQEWASGKIVV